MEITHYLPPLKMDSLDARKEQIAKILNAPMGNYREILNLPCIGLISNEQRDKAFVRLGIFVQEHHLIPKGGEGQSKTEERLNVRSAMQRRKYYPGV